MEFVAALSNRSRLRELNSLAMESPELASVDAAVAYAASDRHPLLVDTLSRGKPLRLWARYDESVPVAAPVLRWFLDRKSNDYGRVAKMGKSRLKAGGHSRKSR